MTSGASNEFHTHESAAQTARSGGVQQTPPIIREMRLLAAISLTGTIAVLTAGCGSGGRASVATTTTVPPATTTTQATTAGSTTSGWEYGVPDHPGTIPGLLRIPDGFDILMPHGKTPTHPTTG